MNEHSNDNNLRRAIDLHGLPSTLNAIADICAEKAVRLRDEWQDGEAAADWEWACAVVLTAHEKLTA